MAVRYLNDVGFTPEDSTENLMRYLRRSRGEERYQRYLRSIMEGYAEPPGLDAECVDPVDGQIRCRAGKASFWITWDGWMLPCGMMVEPKADVKELSFAEAWKQVTDKSAAIRLSGLCDKCPNRDICHPCAAIAYAETGSFAGVPTYRCRAVQQMCRIAREELQNNST